MMREGWAEDGHNPGSRVVPIRSCLIATPACRMAFFGVFGNAFSFFKGSFNTEARVACAFCVAHMRRKEKPYLRNR
jgi:hypothetical protein